VEPSPAEEPTIDSIVATHQAGRAPADIIAWIEASGATFDLDLNEVVRLRSAGVPSEVIAAMARIPDDRLRRILASQDVRPAPPAERRQGLSRRRLLKMIDSGASEHEILKAIAAEGSKASLSLEDAFDLIDKGFSPALLQSIVTGAVAGTAESERPAAGPAAPVPGGAAGTAVPGGPGGQARLATAPARAQPEITEDEEVPVLDEIVGEGEEEEGLEEAPLLEELVPPEEAESGAADKAPFLVFSDQPGARVFVAPASARVTDLLRQARSAGRTPARLNLPPGSHFLIVEKKLDDFDRSLIPALRTVHDGDGRTRTLITSGDLYYDVQRCCVPRSLAGDLSITRISEDQQGTILGDEFGGLPPYLWDGDRYLILVVREARVQRVLKVYEVRKAIGETRALTAAFVPSSGEPLAVAARAPEGSVEEASGPVWQAPPKEDLEGLARIYGIPDEDLERLEPLLAAAGKAIWRYEGPDGTLTLLTLSLDSNGRTRAHESVFRRDGPFGAYSTPRPPSLKRKKGSKKAAPAPPPPLAALSRTVDPAVNLHVLSIENNAESDAVVRLGDGTVVFVPAGETRVVTVSPGSSEVEARFEDEPDLRRTIKAHLTYHSRYSLQLD